MRRSELSSCRASCRQLVPVLLAVIIQGRYDGVYPPRSAWRLHQAWPEARFQMIDDAGHAAFAPGIASALVAATERLKRDGTL